MDDVFPGSAIDYAQFNAAWAALIRGWQEEIVAQDLPVTTMRALCKSLKDWLRAPVSTRDISNIKLEVLEPEKIVERVVQISQQANVSQGLTMMAVLAMIDRLLHAMTTAEATYVTVVWERRLAESSLSQVWLGTDRPTKRISHYP